MLRRASRTHLILNNASTTNSTPCQRRHVASQIAQFIYSSIQFARKSGRFIEASVKIRGISPQLDTKRCLSAANLRLQLSFIPIYESED